MTAFEINCGMVALRGRSVESTPGEYEWRDTKTQETITMYPPATYSSRYARTDDGYLSFKRGCSFDNHVNGRPLFWEKSDNYWKMHIICQKPRFKGE